MAKKSKLMKVIDWALNILIVVFLIGTIYMILWRILGDSPTDFQVISWAVGLFGAAVFKLFSFTYNMNREVGELKTGVRNGFGSVKEGFRRVKEDIGSLKEDMQEIKMLIKKK